MPFIPDTPAQSAAPARTDHFVPDVAPSAPAQSGFWGDFAHELWQQGGQDLLQSLQEHPIGTIAHLLGSAAGISTGTTPVPGPGGNIEVPPAMRTSGPTQMASTADVAERGPAAIAAAITLSALPIALGFGGKAVAGSRVGQATGAAWQAGKEALPSLLPKPIRVMAAAFNKSMAASKAPTSATIPWSQIIARAAEKEPAPLPESVTQELTRPTETAPTPRPAQPAPVAPTVPQAALPAPTATVPPEAPPQASQAPPTGQERAIAGARGLRAANAETLSQALSDAGKTSAEVRGVRVWQWPDVAKQVGVDFPVTHSARLKLIRDTLARLEQREAKP